MNRVVDIEVSCLRYRTNIVRYCMFISCNIEGLSDVQYRRSCHNISGSISYTIYPSPIPNGIHCGAEAPFAQAESRLRQESQRHMPWIPAPSFCAISQLDPQRFDEERSFHSATSTCWFRTAGSQSRCWVLNPLQLSLGSYPWSSRELYWLIFISVNTIRYW